MFIVQTWHSEFNHKNPSINVKWSHALEILVVSSDTGIDLGVNYSLVCLREFQNN